MFACLIEPRIFDLWITRVRNWRPAAMKEKFFRNVWKAEAAKCE